MTSRHRHATTRLASLLIGCVVIAPAFTSAVEKEPEPALGGYCLVSYFEKNQAVKGDPAHKTEHMGDVYHFSSAEAKEKFHANPDKYLPQFAGLCTMALGGPYGNRLPSDPTSFAIVDGRLYLFSQERAKKMWEETPESVIKRADALFEQPRLSGYCPVSYQRDNKAVKGDPSQRSVYKTYVYHTSSPEAKAAFDKDPQQYLPPYGDYCVTHLADRTMKLFDPTLFRVVKDKTYFFHNEDARKRFDADPRKIIRRANARWKYMGPK